MDPVSAIGVAAGAVAFLDFSLKILTQCKRLRESGEAGALQENLDLEERANSLLRMMEALKISDSPSDGIEKQIQHVGSRCSLLAKELQDLLSKTKVQGKGHRALLKGGWKNSRAKDDILRLESMVQGNLELFDTTLLSSIHQTLQNVDFEHTQAFKSLDEATQEVMKKMAKNEQLIIAEHDKTRMVVSSHFQEIQTFISHKIQSENEKTRKVSHFIYFQVAEPSMSYIAVSPHMSVTIICNKYLRVLSSFKESLEAANRKDALLKSLFFEDFKVRQEQVPEPYKSTFRWIFNDGESALGMWDSFAQWLRNGDDIYWIHGKPGAGKSTLMSFILEEKQTKDELRQWTRGEEPICIAFFFYRPGSQLQKSTLGMLRSLLYQLLQQDSEIMPLEIYSTTNIPTWTERAVKSAFLKCLETTKRKICIFIDGLDEFEGDEGSLDLLLDMCFECSRFSNIKLCVSSRPEIHLKRIFKSCQQLRLQDLTHKDMEIFVFGMLGFDELKSVRYAIVSRAEGIFLWTSLVANTLLRAYRNHDSVEVLLQRLQAMPSGLESLYMHMLHSIDPWHADKARSYFLMVQFTRREDLPMPGLSIFTLALAADSKPLRATQKDWTSIAELAELVKLCQFTEDVLQIYCKGFLETSQRYGTEPLHRNEKGIEAASETIFRFQTRIVTFAHRTAYDFIFDNKAGQSFIAEGSDSVADLEINLVKGFAGLFFFLVFTPSLSDLSLRQLQTKSFKTVVEAASSVKFLVSGRDAFLDQFCHHICSLGNKGTISSLRSWLDKQSISSNPVYRVLLACANHPRLYAYVYSRLHAVLPEALADAALLSRLSGRSKADSEAVRLQHDLISRIESKIPPSATSQIKNYRHESSELRLYYNKTTVMNIDYAAAGLNSMIGTNLAKTMRRIALLGSEYLRSTTRALMSDIPNSLTGFPEAQILKLVDFARRLRQLVPDGYTYIKAAELSSSTKEFTFLFSAELLLNRLLFEKDPSAKLIKTPISPCQPSPWILNLENHERRRIEISFGTSGLDGSGYYTLTLEESNNLEMLLFKTVDEINHKHDPFAVFKDFEGFFFDLLKVFDDTTQVGVVRDLRQYAEGVSKGEIEDPNDNLHRQAIEAIRRLRISEKLGRCSLSLSKFVKECLELERDQILF